MNKSLVLIGTLQISACADSKARERYFGNGQIWSSIEIEGGVANGSWTTWYENGQMESRGTYLDGMRWGPCDRWYEDGKKHITGEYVAGIEEGSWAINYPTGLPRTAGDYREGTLSGTWLLWSQEGTLLTSVEHKPTKGDAPVEVDLKAGETRRLHHYFALGQRNGTSLTFFESGVCSMREEYQGDRLHGPSQAWWPVGSPKSHGEYVQGARQGEWYFWRVDGSMFPKVSGTYVDGKRVAGLTGASLEFKGDMSPPQPKPSKSMSDQGPRSSEHFSSRWVSLLSLFGVAIGLGNVWRFPYMMGQNGGSAFLSIYLLFVVLLAVPALAGEWALGRSTGGGTVGAFRATFGARVGKPIAFLLVLSITIATSYYVVIVAQVGFTAGFALAPGFSAGNSPHYQKLMGDPWLVLACSGLTLAGAFAVLARGLKGGIELASRLFVPIFGLSALVLAVLSMLQEGALAHMGEFTRPDLSRLGSAKIFAALGQACYSVGVGGTFMLTYGRFMWRETPLLSTAISTSMLESCNYG